MKLKAPPTVFLALWARNLVSADDICLGNQGGNCLDAGNLGKPCCDITGELAFCFKKNDNYGQCRASCPSGRNPLWACESVPTPAPTSTPTPQCAQKGGNCIDGNLDSGGSMMGCCDASKTCFRKGAGYGQCKDVCPTNTDWGCYTSPPTVAPTSAPTGAPTYACIFHTATGASANCRLDGIERPCCDTSKKCFAKTDTYGQCKDVCPSNTDWDCYTAAPSNSPTSSPTSAPTTTCVAEGADCIEGDLDAGTGSVSRCCDPSRNCVRKNKNYGQCKDTCPINADWDCYTQSPTSAPSPSPTAAPTVASTMNPTAANVNTLKDAGALHGLPIGCVINYAFLDDPTKVGQTTDMLDEYTGLAGSEYNWLTEENGCKWRYSDQWDRVRCVEMLEFAQNNSMAFRGHALVWGKAASNPDYFDEECVYDSEGNMPGRCKEEVGDWTVEEKYAIMDTHVKNESEYYAGRLAAWDVVNEAVCDCWLSFSSCEEFVKTNGDRCGKSELYSGDYDVYLKKNIYWPAMPDYIGRAFLETKKYDTVASLGYNDYKFEALTGWQKEKSDMVYQLIKSLKEQDVPIDYVGSQTHIDLGYMHYEEGGGTPNANNFLSDISYLESVKRNMDRYARIGVEWHFTELTIAINDPYDGENDASSTTFSDAKDNEQADLYDGLMDVCLDNVRCTCFQTWGFVDGWTKAYAGLKPYPFDTEYAGKKSFDDMMVSMKRTKPTARWTEGWCAAAGEKCSVDSDCCTSGEACYKMGEFESYCKESCPSGWRCESDDSDDTGECVIGSGKCTGGLSCCDGYQCFTKNQYYSQCKTSCPDDSDWECYNMAAVNFSGSSGELMLVGGGLIAVFLGMAVVAKRLCKDCRSKTPGNAEADNIDLTSNDANDMFFRHHNAFEDDKKL